VNMGQEFQSSTASLLDGRHFDNLQIGVQRINIREELGDAALVLSTPLYCSIGR